MSDNAKSIKASDERQAEVAARLGMDPAELVVYSNVDGEYAVVKDGTRLLLQDGGRIAWYGDTAPNPTYPLVVPSVELDESEPPDVDEVEDPGVAPVDEPPAPVEPKPADDGAAKPVEPVEDKKPTPAKATAAKK